MGRNRIRILMLTAAALSVWVGVMDLLKQYWWALVATFLALLTLYFSITIWEPKNEKGKRKKQFCLCLLIGIAAVIVVISLVVVSWPTEEKTSLPTFASTGRIEISSPIDQEAVKQAVFASQFYALNFYVKPKDFDKGMLSKYWVPVELGGKEAAQVLTDVQRLISKGWHYGEESKNEIFEFRYSPRIFAPGDYAEVGTRELWYIPRKTEEGTLVKERDPKFGPNDVDYTLRKINGAWMILDSTTRRAK